MATRCCDICFVLIDPFLRMFMFASILVGIIGTAKYVPEKHDESVYKSTICFVLLKIIHQLKEHIQVDPVLALENNFVQCTVTRAT